MFVTHGEVPSASEGWIPDRPSYDPELRIERITTVRFDDGSTQRFYLMKVKRSVLEAKRALVRKKLKESRRSLRDAKKRQAKERRQLLRKLFRG